MKQIGWRKGIGIAVVSLGAALILAPRPSAHALATPAQQIKRVETLEELGGALFADRNLSFSRRQNCVSCHSPELAFTDPRQLGEVKGAVSRGGDGRSLGDRNAPTLAYAALIPRFEFAASGEANGGLFHDGRAAGLDEQAVGPITNPVEMGMPDRASVVARVAENPSYVEAFSRLFGGGTLADVEKSYRAIGSAIAAFERTKPFLAFDSRYDRSLRGETELSELEEAGRDLFFSDNANCTRCHLQSREPGTAEIFTNARYYNLGVPPNKGIRSLNGKGEGFVDRGLADNPAIKNADLAHGRYRVPTLRNVAITGPYMHNGVFQELRTAIAFHDRFKGQAGSQNPETNAPWDEPEVAVNLAHYELQGQPLTQEQIDALAAFLATLTDRRYEHLLGGP
ncbi:MAG TPA: cytochrome c peroxidase [Hyphomicrobium sp.]|nr:cytochrome c peroxidase [Hyphomicrobium sp.]